ncbi:hypothetical protein QU38_00720, partial [Staphylococcus aureus]
GIQRQPADQDRAAAEAIGERPHDQLAGAEAGEEQRQHRLQMVAVRDRECRADVRQRRQHHVHGERVQRHDRGDRQHEFGEAHRLVRSRRGGVGVGLDIGHVRGSCETPELRPFWCTAQPMFGHGRARETRGTCV